MAVGIFFTNSRRLLTEGLRGELVQVLQTLMQELVPGHESGLAIIEKSEQLLRLLLEIVEVDTLFLSPRQARGQD